jgi:predicted RNase H-like nuclease (RuvC/YqgF family)
MSSIDTFLQLHHRLAVEINDLQKQNEMLKQENEKNRQEFDLLFNQLNKKNGLNSRIQQLHYRFEKLSEEFHELTK